jgi:transketolase
MKMDRKELETLSVNQIRFLAADGIQKANSGHPGLPMGAAPMAYVLWTKHLKHNPKNPCWPDRDRFVLSGGHGSMLLYSLLHLTGYDLPLDQLKNFRQWGSKTPGHPECRLTPGVEATTGPLGQGLSHAVGMAIAEAHLAARCNRPGHAVVDHHTYVLASDGDLMEGVASEACSLAGHLKLGKLVVLYDDNQISLAGTTSLAFTENVEERFEAYGWQVLRVADGNDLGAISRAITRARDETARPSLIMVRTIIGYGAPKKQNTSGVHGSPLGEEELMAAKKALFWPVEPPFLIFPEILENFRKALKKGEKCEEEWKTVLARYAAEFPDQANEFERMMKRELPAGWEAGIPDFAGETKSVATRKASEAVLQVLGKNIPELIGGSADLNPSTLTWIKGGGDFEPTGPKPEGVQGAVGEAWGYEGRNIHFGVREHAMGSIAGGIALHGGLIPYTATFLTFSDYMRPPMRLAAMDHSRVIYVFTHDSIGLGEDGPTHQPVEQLMVLRAVPNLVVLRPADAAETAEAWKIAVSRRDGPVALVFTRQNLPVLDRTRCAPAAGTAQGGYTLWETPEGHPEIILIGTGSEVHLAREAGDKLAAEGKKVRVVSLPSWEIFDSQPAEYRESVLPSSVRKRVAVEAGNAKGWERYVGLDGKIVGMTGFGASAPAEVLYQKFGITVENIVAQAKSL